MLRHRRAPRCGNICCFHKNEHLDVSNASKRDPRLLGRGNRGYYLRVPGLHVLVVSRRLGSIGASSRNTAWSRIVSRALAKPTCLLVCDLAAPGPGFHCSYDHQTPVACHRCLHCPAHRVEGRSRARAQLVGGSPLCCFARGIHTARMGLGYPGAAVRLFGAVGDGVVANDGSSLHPAGRSQPLWFEIGERVRAWSRSPPLPNSRKTIHQKSYLPLRYP